MKPINLLEKSATRKTALILLATTAVSASCLITGFYGLLNLDPGATLDPLSCYGREIFYSFLDIQGEAGRQSYLLLHLVDYLFITQFYPLLTIAVYKAAGKTGRSRIVSFLVWLPLVSAAADLMENILIDVAILLYPGRIEVMGTLSGLSTSCKMYTIYAVFLTIAVLLARRGIMAIVKRE